MSVRLGHSLLIRAVQKLIAINRIQNKSLCLHNIFVCAVHNYFVYINTHTCMYIFKKMCCIPLDLEYVCKPSLEIELYALCILCFKEFCPNE